MILKLLSLLGVAFALFAKYQNDRQVSHLTMGCEKLRLGEENPRLLEELKQEASYLTGETVGIIKKFMTARARGELDDPDPKGVTKRVQHARGWGCLKGVVEITSNNETFGSVFSEKGRKINVDIRLSANSFDADSDPKVTAIALKFHDIRGKRVDPTLVDPDEALRKENQYTMDQVYVSAESLPFVSYVKDLFEFHDYLIWGNVPGALFYLLKSNPIFFFRMVGYLLGGRGTTNPFHAEHFTVSPQKFGQKFARLMLTPCDASVKMSPIPANAGKYFLSQVIQEDLNNKEVCMDMYAQFQSDSCRHALDDHTSPWEKSDWYKVARLTIPKNSVVEPQEKCERLSFNPWHTLEEYSPLGFVARLRQFLYGEGAKYRNNENKINNKL